MGGSDHWQLLIHPRPVFAVKHTLGKPPAVQVAGCWKYVPLRSGYADSA